MAETNIPPVPVNTPMLDGRGLLTQAWQRFMYALKQRAGGDNAPTNNDLLLNPMSTVGDVIYGGALGSATRLPGNTTTSQKFLAQTGSGTAAGAPTWVTLAASDIPNLSFSKITTGTVPVAQGGTGQTTQQTAMDALAGTQSSGKYLRSDGTHTTLSLIQAADVPTLNQNTSGTASSATTATKPAAGSAHGAVTLDGSGNFQSVAPSTSGNVLTSNGTDWVSSANAASLPSGMITPYGGSSAPAGWLLCDGSAVSRSTYAALFTAIGTTFGVGDGSTTFNVPDMRGVFPKGAGTTSRTAGKDSSGNFYAGTLGTYSTDQLQGHYHNNVSSNGGSLRDSSGASGGNVGGTQVASAASVNSPLIVATAPVTDGTNGTPRTGHTTEPQSLGLTYIVKQ